MDSVYTKESARRGVSFFADLVAAATSNDPAAVARLAEHQAVSPSPEPRTVGFVGFNLPQYLDPATDEHSCSERCVSANITEVTTIIYGHGDRP